MLFMGHTWLRMSEFSHGKQWPSGVDTHNTYTWAGVRCPYYIVTIIIVIIFNTSEIIILFPF